MKILIAIISCSKFRHRADAQRNTWIPLVRNADVRFFLGQDEFGTTQLRPDEIILNVPDGYKSLPYKIRATMRWALDHGYTYICKLDDDVYVQPERLLTSDFHHDYIGATRSLPSKKFKARYASGFAYWLSRAAMKVLVKAEIADWAEDRWVGNTLAKAGIYCHPDYRYTIINSLNLQNAVSGTEGPRVGNDVIAVAELTPKLMFQVHNEWLTAPSQIVRDGIRDKLSIFRRDFPRRIRFRLKLIAGRLKQIFTKWFKSINF